MLRLPGTALMTVMLTLACSGESASSRRVIVLGFDGMDYQLTSRLMSEGKLPNLQRLATSGSFSALATSIPPQSPVAWSDFITGMDAGGHGIFDFLHRDSLTMVPYLSTSQARPPSRFIRIGRWQIPLKAGKMESLRYGTPFWEVLERHGIRTSVIRMPANFPPSGSATRELSGMGTPDLLGTPGTFSFYTTVPGRIAPDVAGGTVHTAKLVDNVFHGTLRGPPNPFSVAGDALAQSFVVYVDPLSPVAKIVLGNQETILREGEWSEWLEVRFNLLGSFQTLRGSCRFFLRQTHPELELYVTPFNIDPLNPAMPISTPPKFAAELARAAGRFYTQGMPEDTKALAGGVFNDAEFLRQAAMAADENRRQYEHLLASFDGGFLFWYFGNLDQVSHMMWRAMDPEHPAHDPIADKPYAHVIENLYVQADSVVGKTLERMRADDMLVVMSDHGFASWTRAFNLNSWLKHYGYVSVRSVSPPDSTGFFANVDWTQTQAYAVGLNGLNVNLRGREAVGSVPANQRQSLLDEISRGLLRFVDPKTGKPAITKVYQRDQIYGDRGQLNIGPDLVIGYARGVRSSEGSALGRFSREIITDNTGKWSGDHLMDHETVPGVLFSSAKLRREVTSLKNLAAAILAEFDIAGFPSDTNRRGPVRKP